MIEFNLGRKSGVLVDLFPEDSNLFQVPYVYISSPAQVVNGNYQQKSPGAQLTRMRSRRGVSCEPHMRTGDSMALRWESSLAMRGYIYLCQESVLLKPRKCTTSTVATVADLSEQPDNFVVKIPGATSRSAVPYFWLIQYDCITVDFLGWSFCREAESPSFQVTSREVSAPRATAARAMC